jgi:hypothetical protein
MQPTANSVAFMRETWNVSRLSARRLMASVGRFDFESLECYEGENENQSFD